MARKDSRPEVNRRKFLAGVAVAGAATAVSPPQNAANAATTTTLPTGPGRAKPSALPPSGALAAAETGTPQALANATRPDGSDFMVDVIKTLDIEYLPSNAASSFRGLHESLINYGGNKKPEFLTCTHEECAVAMGHGYFKVAGKPMMTLAHGTVGLQHACMAVYNAWCDRVPVIIVGGNDLDAAKRPPGVPTFHSAQDINALVRDFTKWDDTPVSLQHFAQSMVRAYKIAMTPPYAPVAISLDAGLQQEPIHNGEKLSIPRYVPTSPPQGDSGAVREAAQLLANAERPVIVVDRAARTPNGIKLLVQLAELLQAPVVDQGARMNFPKTHHLSRAPGVIGQADVVIGMELSDYWATVNAWIDNGDHGHGIQESRIKAGTKLISISSVDLLTKANYQDFQRFQVVDVQMAADAEATLPALIEAVKSAIPADRKAAIEKRGEALAQGQGGSARAQPGGDGDRLGREPDQHRAAVHGGLGADQGSRLVDGRLRPPDEQLAVQDLADGEALPPSRPFGRLRPRLQSVRRGRCRARQPSAWTVLGQSAARRRLHVFAGRAVDGGAPSDPDAHRDAQQPRLPSGSDARAAPVQSPQPGCEPGQDHGSDRHLDRSPGYRLCEDGIVDGLVVGRSDQGSGATHSDAQARGRGGQVRPARAGRRLDAAALRTGTMSGMRVKWGLAALAAGLLIGQGAAIAASAEKGKAAYMTFGCWGCHGTVGQGGITGPKLAPDPMPAEAFTAFVRTTNRAMPPYREAVLSNEDLADIYAYLQSIPKPADYKTIPLLKQ